MIKGEDLTWIVFWCGVFALIILFAGEPDLMDAIRGYLLK